MRPLWLTVGLPPLNTNTAEWWQKDKAQFVCLSIIMQSLWYYACFFFLTEAVLAQVVDTSQKQGKADTVHATAPCFPFEQNLISSKWGYRLLPVFETSIWCMHSHKISINKKIGLKKNHLKSAKLKITVCIWALVSQLWAISWVWSQRNLDIHILVNMINVSIPVIVTLYCAAICGVYYLQHKLRQSLKLRKIWVNCKLCTIKFQHAVADMANPPHFEQQEKRATRDITPDLWLVSGCHHHCV